MPSTLPTPRATAIVLMGVSGSGKTTVGRRLSEALGWDFADGDDFHPEANRRKMAAGTPLNDADRRPWLLAIRDFLAKRIDAGEPVVLACSALKATYRELLVPGDAPDGAVALVYLRGSRDLIRERLEGRADHFFDPDLLDSQFDALEPPSPDEAVVVDVDGSPDAIVRAIGRRLPSG